MKAEKKRVGTKAQIRASKERERRIATAIFLAFILLIVIFSAYFTYNFLNQPQNQTRNPASSQLKAAIVDHLSLTFPNQTFIETATNILKQAGYAVNYYPGEKVTVEFYRNLPTHYYALIILRVHSAGLSAVGAAELQLFTCEAYSRQKYIKEQLAHQVGIVKYSASDTEMYFGICPGFVQQCMKGGFKNTTIVMMGCDGLMGTQMAEAFIQKGAKAYISWSESVLAGHTDQATTHLLKHLLTEKQTIEQAVTETMKEVGPDPAYKSLLIYYPLEVGDQIIEDIAGNPATNP